MTELDAVTDTIATVLEAMIEQGRKEGDIVDALLALLSSLGTRVHGDERMSLLLRGAADHHLSRAASTASLGASPVTPTQKAHATLAGALVGLRIDGLEEDDALRAMFIYSSTLTRRQLGDTAFADWLAATAKAIRRGTNGKTAH